MIIRRLKKWTYAVCLFSILSVFWLAGQLLIFTKNTSALRHEYMTIPLFSMRFKYPYSGFSEYSTPGFGFRWVNPYQSSTGSSSLKRQVFLKSNYNSSSLKCVYSNYSLVPLTNNGYGYDFYYPSVIYGSSTSSVDPNSANAVCQTNLAFGSTVDSDYFPNISSIPPFDRDTFPGFPYNQNIEDAKQNLPYIFGYDHFYLKNTGEYGDRTYSHVLKFSDFYTSTDLSGGGRYIPTNFYELILPFDSINTDITGALTYGRDISFDGQFSFNDVTVGDGLDFAPHFFSDGTHKIIVKYFNYGSSVGGDFEIPCTFTTVQLFNSTTLKYSCSTTVPVNVPSSTIFIPYMVLTAYSSDNYILSTTSDWGWSGAFLTTDNDTTPGAVISEDCQGYDCQNAPGSAYQDYLEDNPEQVYDLSNLFHFNISNPFQPIFGLFIDSSTCYNIPIIAGFLHVEDSEHFQYCPWFPSSVRDVLTPVFGLSASMLLFGFIVKWLKSSSGNFESDSSGGAE